MNENSETIFEFHNEDWDNFSHNPEQEQSTALFAAQGAAGD